VPEIKTPGSVVKKTNLSLQCRFPVVKNVRVEYDVRWYFGVDLKLKYSEKVIVNPLEVSEAHSSLQPDVHKDAGISDDDMQNVGVVFTASLFGLSIHSLAKYLSSHDKMYAKHIEGICLDIL